MNYYYLFLIASIITGCSLIALLLMYLYHRRMKWNYNMKIVGIDFGSICPVLKPEK